MTKFNSSSSNGRVTVNFTLGKKYEKIKKEVTREYHRISANKGKDIMSKDYIFEVQKIIRSGGLNSKRWSWSYWERKRISGFGWTMFTPENDRKISTFTVGFKTKGKRVQRYAVHPSTFKTLRNIRKYPLAKTYAMLDNGMYINSFKPILVKSNMTKTHVAVVTSKGSWHRIHEFGFIWRGSLVKRPHTRPAFEIFMKKSSNGKKYFRQIIIELRLYADSILNSRGSNP